MTAERHEYADGRVAVLRADVHAGLVELADASVDCIITSPPFWRLRSYLKTGDPLKPLEIGGEATPEEYVAGLVDVFSRCWRVLKPTGTLWVELGDSYTKMLRGPVGRAPGVGADQSMPEMPSPVKWKAGGGSNFEWTLPGGQKSGDLCLIPARFALAMQAAGWTMRSVVIWHHISAMPESINGWRWERCKVKVKSQGPPQQDYASLSSSRLQGGLVGHSGYCCPNKAIWQPCPGCDKCCPNGGYVLRRANWRPTTGHSYIFMFARGERYFCDAEAAREPATQATAERNRYTRITATADEEQYAVQHDHEFTASGANPRTVWPLSPEPCRFTHYAAFPSGLPRKIIAVATPERGCCPRCGAPWAPVVEISHPNERDDSGRTKSTEEQCLGKTPCPERGWESNRAILDYRPTCACPLADPVPAVVLDPFAGTGTTLATALELGRNAIGIELNPAYLPFIAERINQVTERRRIEHGGMPLTGDPVTDVAIEGPRTFF